MVSKLKWSQKGGQNRLKYNCQKVNCTIESADQFIEMLGFKFGNKVHLKKRSSNK